MVTSSSSGYYSGANNNNSHLPPPPPHQQHHLYQQPYPMTTTTNNNNNPGMYHHNPSLLQQQSDHHHHNNSTTMLIPNDTMSMNVPTTLSSSTVGGAAGSSSSALLLSIPPPVVVPPLVQKTTAELTRQTLVMFVQEHISTLIRESISVQRHSKRARIHQNEILITTSSSSSTTQQQQQQQRNQQTTSISTSNGNTTSHHHHHHQQQMTTTTTSSTSSSFAAVMIQPMNRNRLHASDVNMALQLMGNEKLYGTVLTANTTTTTAATTNGTNDNTNQNSSTGNTTNPTNVSTSTSNSNENLNQGIGTGGILTKKIMLSDWLHTEEIPSPPNEIALHYQWLAINGQTPYGCSDQTLSSSASAASSTMNPFQLPNVTENHQTAGLISVPVPSDSTSGGNNMSGPSGSGGVSTTTTGTSAAASLRVNQLQSSILSEELKLYYTKVTNTIESYCNHQNHNSANSSNKNTNLKNNNNNNNHVRLQKLTNQLDVVLKSIANDPGLQELVPFFIRYCQQELFHHMNMNGNHISASASFTGNHNNNTTTTTTTKKKMTRVIIAYTMLSIEHCRTLIRFSRALLMNRQLHLELHLHELLPALVTCVVAEKVCQPTNFVQQQQQHHNSKVPNNTTTSSTTNKTTASVSSALLSSSSSSSSSFFTVEHYTLRREAAIALYEACQLFHVEYPTLKSRILRAYCQAISGGSSKSGSKQSKHPRKNLISQYGGIYGITLFGTRSIDSFLLPMILSEWNIWEVQLHELNKIMNVNMAGATKLQYEIHMLQQISLTALCSYLQCVPIEEITNRLCWTKDIENIFADQLLPLVGDSNNFYSTCFI